MRMLGGVVQAAGTAGAKALRQYLRNFKVALWPEQNKLQQEVSLERVGWVRLCGVLQDFGRYSVWV